MSKRVLVRSHEYYDSVRLMQIAEALRREPGVTEAILVMATDSNKRLLRGPALLTEDAERAGRNDLIVALVAESEEFAEQALLKADALLRGKAVDAVQLAYYTLGSALSALPDANLAVISVPGEYAAAEGRRALESGLNVFLFSDNVPLKDEVSLKQMAKGMGLLVMGPDCGTASVNGVCLGFANVVRRGSVGIVGASGTGIQQISVLVHRWGQGISHALGTGGRDLSALVGGATMLRCLDLLEADESTRVIVLTSKPPDETVARQVLERVSLCTKPVVVNFLGGEPDLARRAGATPAATLEEAAWEAVRLAAGMETLVASTMDAEVERRARDEASALVPQQRHLRGIYSGGTLCYEAMLVLKRNLGDVYSNVASRSDLRLEDSWRSHGDTVVDLGEDEFTRGRAHPMIDPTLRVQRLIQEADDPEVAVLLLDVVLGYGSHPDPAGSLAGPIRDAKQRARQAGRHLAVVASVCGTDEDPQNLRSQESSLAEAGVLMLPSNAQAGRVAGLIAKLARSR